MTNPRPLLLGYIRADASTTERQLVQSTSDLAAFAEQEGYALATVLVEWVDNAAHVFENLVEQMTEIRAHALVVPGPILLACAPCRRP